jgi:GST-like protein
MATYPWLRHKLQGQDLADFPHLQRWYNAIKKRPAMQRGVAVMADGPSPQPNSEETWSNMFGAKQFEHC